MVKTFLILFYATGLFSSPSQAQNASAERPLYLTTEDGTVVSVFNQPGHNWKTCSKEKGCEAVGWLPSNAQVIAIGPGVEKLVENPYTSEMENTVFYKIKFSYVPEGFAYTKEGTGWVDSSYLSSQRIAKFYSTNKTNEPSKPPCKSAPPSGIENTQKTIGPLDEMTHVVAINDISNTLMNYVGKCVHTKDQMNAKLVEKWKGQKPYKAAVEPIIKKTSPPKIRNEQQAFMTQKQLVEIDALARTLYGELAKCFKEGLEYPIAVAKIASNRLGYVKNPQTTHKQAALFIESDVSQSKANLTDVLTKKMQFHVWNTPANPNEFKSLRLVLCPPRNKNEDYWLGSKPSSTEIEIFHNAVKIATEAVLFPHFFEKRTAKIEQYYFSSGENGFYNKTRVHPTVHGRRIQKNKCVSLWGGPPG